MSRTKSRRKKRTNRSARILTTLFSVIIVTSFVLSLLGPSVFQDDDEPLPTFTYVFPTPVPFSSPTPAASATPTAGVPPPVLVTPTASP